MSVKQSVGMHTMLVVSYTTGILFIPCIVRCQDVVIVQFSITGTLFEISKLFGIEELNIRYTHLA